MHSADGVRGGWFCCDSSAVGAAGADEAPDPAAQAACVNAMKATKPAALRMGH
jgi:hypothetical protein